MKATDESVTSERRAQDEIAAIKARTLDEAIVKMKAEFPVFEAFADAILRAGKVCGYRNVIDAIVEDAKAREAKAKEDAKAREDASNASNAQPSREVEELRAMIEAQNKQLAQLMSLVTPIGSRARKTK